MSPLTLTPLSAVTVLAQSSSQGSNYKSVFTDGSLRRIRLVTTTLRVVPATRYTQSGLSEAVFSRNGNPLDRFCGLTENVRSAALSSLMATDVHLL